MNVVGHGIDLVEINRFVSLLDDAESDLMIRCFTNLERAESEKLSATRNETLAGKFAAKEAVAKALGSGFDGTISPLDIEIERIGSSTPRVILREAALVLAGSLHISSWRLSISHAGGMAIASAIALRD